ncbi:MAG: SET domain-containing protein [Saprospiraceae bacterium]|nr:SET domain-containing protein [Candidatus Opimibacter iunctus]
MIHPDTALQYIDDEIGYGLFATKKIPRGTITWALDRFDQVYTPDQLEMMDQLHLDILDKYSYRNSLSQYVLCWDFGRYVNHSFNSNSLSTGYDFEIAIRDILPGEELTNDYGYLNLEEPFEARPENSPRTQVYPDDLLRYHEQWDAIVRDSFPLILQVQQPLMQLLSSDLQKEINEVINGQRKMKSILNHYFEDSKMLIGQNN